MKIKTSWFFFFLSMLILLPLRVYQRLFSLDIHMGFSKKDDFSLSILLGALIVFTLFLIWLCAKDKKAPDVYLEKPNFIAGLFAFFLAASVGVESVFLFLGADTNDVMNTSKIILSVIGLIGAIAFLILCIDAFRGANTFGRHPYLSLILPLWGFARLTVNFIQFNTETGQENMFDTFSMIACLLFLYSQSRLFVGIERKKSLKSTFSFGFCAILTGMMAILPRYLGYVLINYYPVDGVSNQIYNQGLTPFPTDLIFALYAFSFLVGLYFQSYKKGMKLEAENEQPSAASDEYPSVEASAEAEQSTPPSYPDDPAPYSPASPNPYYAGAPTYPADPSPYQNMPTGNPYYAGEPTYPVDPSPYQNPPAGNPYYAGDASPYQNNPYYSDPNNGYGQPAPPNDYNPYYQGYEQAPYDPNRQNDYYPPQPPNPYYPR